LQILAITINGGFLQKNMSGGKIKVLIVLAIILVVGILFVGKASAAVTITTATGGTAVSIDTTSSAGGTGAWTTLTGPIITEATSSEIATSTAAQTLTLPIGWEFNTSVAYRVATSGTANEFRFSTSSAIASSLTFTVTASSTLYSGRYVILTFSNLQVRPTGTATSTGSIYQSAGAITGVTKGAAGTSFGTLTAVVGAVNKLRAYRAPVVGTTVDDVFTTQPIISVTDQFGEGVGSETVTAAVGTGTAGKLGGTLTATSNNNGSTTYSDLYYKKSGETFTITFTDGLVSTTSASLGPLSAGASSALTVETASSGSGTTVSAQSLDSGSTITAYSILRDQYGNFKSNTAATAWSLANQTGNVNSGDLIAASDSKSATMTGGNSGTATIHATLTSYTPADSGTITVGACSPFSVAHGTVAAYPTCTITCNTDYTLSGSSCDLTGGGGGVYGGGGGSITYSPAPATPPATGVLVKYADSPKVYIIENGQKRWIPTAETFNALGYNWNNIVTLIDATYPDGPDKVVGSTAPNAPAGTAVYTKLLSVGMRGDLVKQLQDKLKALGYFPADMNSSGFYGSVTRDAVKKFQQANGIEQTGATGPKTRAKLNSL